MRRKSNAETVSDKLMSKFVKSRRLKVFDKPWAGYSYHIEETRMNTDPFVRKALKQFDYELYDSIRGYTKKATVEEGLLNLLNYDTFLPTQKRIHQDPLMTRYFHEAIEEVDSMFRPDELLNRLGMEHVADNLDGSSSAGFSWPGKKKHEVIEDIFDMASFMSHHIRNDKHVFTPYVKVAFRGHLSQIESPKVRPVWNYPAEILLLEGVWAMPLYWHLTKKQKYMAGPTALKKLMFRSSIPLEPGHAIEVNTDWSKFDQNVPEWLINIAFDMMKSWFSPRGWEIEGAVTQFNEKDDRGWNRIWAYLQSYFVRTRIMLPNGKMVQKQHGVPSGSMFTQIVDTIVNAIVVRATMKYMNLPVSDDAYLGDDAVFIIKNRFIIKSSFSVHTFAKIAKKFFGFKLNVEKTDVRDAMLDRKFLGYTYQNGRFTRPREDWFKLALYAERDVESLEKSSSRMVAFYILGGCNDSLFCRFFWYYYGVYPVLWDKPVVPTAATKRLAKFVLGISYDDFKLPTMARFDAQKACSTMVCGTRPFT